MWAEFLLKFCIVIGYAVISIGLFQHVIDFMQGLFAMFIFRREKVSSELVFDMVKADYRLAPAISIFVPAYNESVTIATNVYNLAAINYPNHQIIVINDGSKDDTLAVLKKEFKLKKKLHAYKSAVSHAKIKSIWVSTSYPNVTVIDKENGGKADSLNAALNVCRTPLFCVIDADSVLKEDALTRAIRPFIEYPDNVLAVGGVISGMSNLDMSSGRVKGNTISYSLLENIQALEYFRAFLLGRMFWNEIDSTFIVSGAFGIFRRDVVLKVGGYSEDIVGEDIELIFKLKKYAVEHGIKNAIKFVPDPVCWTEVPNSLKILSRQRKRWQQGMIETLFMHKNILFNPKYGVFGLVSFPYLFLTEVLFLPISFLGYVTIPILYALGYFNTEFFLAFLAVEFLLGVFISNMSLQVKEMQDPSTLDVLDMMIFNSVGVLENFGFRQCCTLWRFLGFIKYFSGSKSWGEMTREGLS